MKIKPLLTLALTLCAALTSPTWAAAPTAPPPVTGEVLEVKDVDSYTYLRLKTSQGESWAAVTTAPVKKGTTVTIDNVSVMTNFESKTLKKTFPIIFFGTLAGNNAKAAADPHTGMAKAVITGPIKVAKATGANAQTVSDVVTKATALKDKPVKVSGKVVKFNGGIMGKNWIHLQDGTGTDASGTNDVLVTTTAEAKVGDVVTVSGVVHTNKDFGSGYSYKVLIEDATLQH